VFNIENGLHQLFKSQPVFLISCHISKNTWLYVCNNDQGGLYTQTVLMQKERMAGKELPNQICLVFMSTYSIDNVSISIDLNHTHCKLLYLLYHKKFHFFNFPLSVLVGPLLSY